MSGWFLAVVVFFVKFLFRAFGRSLEIYENSAQGDHHSVCGKVLVIQIIYSHFNAIIWLFSFSLCRADQVESKTFVIFFPVSPFIVTLDPTVVKVLVPLYYY